MHYSFSMRYLSIHKWFYIKSAIFLMVIFGPFSQVMAHKYERTLLGFWGAIGGVRLPKLKQYATEHGYKDVKTPFCHLDLEGALYVESRVWNHMGFRIELGPRYTHPSFTGVVDQNKIKQSIGLHCHGGHFSTLLYVYPSGRFADNGNWNGHIGVSLSEAASKTMAINPKTKKNDKFDTYSAGLILGVGFEFISGLQLECRSRWKVKRSDSAHTIALQGVWLAIGYLFK